MFVGVLGAITVAAGGQLSRQVFAPGPAHPSIDYFGETSDVVGRLAERIGSGAVDLETGGFGYLESLLDQLDIPVASQVAVFSKNSLQKPYIRPSNPRLIYFNDSAFVAAIRGAPLVELAALDPEKGVIFYTLEQSAAAPRLVRQGPACLVCHDSLNSQGVPGLLLRSVPPSPDGSANPHLGNYLINHRSPFEERWAGWYVTGEHGFRHLGNGVATDMRDIDSLAGNQRPVLESLDGDVPPSALLGPTSDVVALMVLDHQVDMTNLLVRYGWEVRYALEGGRAGSANLDAALDEVVEYMFFTGEPPIVVPVTGSSRFRAEFEARGPVDSEGRSLRQLDLETRLMRYPLSYMIYSEVFSGLPAEARQAIYERIEGVLDGQGGERYEHLTPADRAAIAEILVNTKDDLPVSFGGLRD